ncbi:hypothetical protein C8R43DRAFT_1132762 [Mycena crocata]|nr:hypothetical protein C8R43DRAFT_1132762 [Mycena crocata]
MYGVHASPLGDDIVDRIMTFCPTFGTLQAMVSASKDFRRIFDTHPKSITCAVTYNIIGPALPQALRVIRYPYARLHGGIANDESVRSDDEYASSDEEGKDLVASEDLKQFEDIFDVDDDHGEDTDDDDMQDFIEEAGSIEADHGEPSANSEELDDPVEMATTCPEDHLPSLITTQEKKELKSLAKDVAALEDIYSLTTKDRTSKTSVLTADESFRFRRAIYRIMLYTSLFSLTQYYLDEMAKLSPDDLQNIFQQRTAVLNAYPTDELFEIASAVKFLRSIFEAVDDVDGHGPPSSLLDMLIAAGPKSALKAWQSRSYRHIRDHLGEQHGDRYEFYFFADQRAIRLFMGYLSRAFDEIWTARNVQPPGRDEGSDKWVLDSVNGKSDTCSQCAAPGGVSLFTQANWSRLPVYNPQNLLKNKLRENTTIYNPFIRMWYKNDRSLSDSDDLGTWITSLFALYAASRAMTGCTWANAGSTSANIAPTSTSMNIVSTALAPQTLATLRHASFAVFYGWDARLSYCRLCLRRFLDAHIGMDSTEGQSVSATIPAAISDLDAN